MKKNIFAHATILSIILFLITSCQTDTDLEQPFDSKEQGEEITFLFEEDVKVYDTQKRYFVMVKIKANSKAILRKAIHAKPYITIGKPTQKPSKKHPLLEQPILNKKGEEVLYHLTSNRSIPKNISYHFHTGNIGEPTLGKAGCGVAGDDIETATLQDDMATKVWTFNSSNCSIEFNYYSRGKYWYSWGWYNRGVRNLENYESHTFDVSNYTSTKGIKVTAARYHNLDGMDWSVTQ